MKIKTDAKRLYQHFALILAVAVTFGVAATPAQATLYDLNLNTTPDIKSDGILFSYNYNSGSPTLTANGIAEFLNATTPITSGLFSLTATLNSSDVLQGGTVSITDKTGTLIAGNLTEIEYGSTSVPSGAGGSLGFLFAPTLGSLKGDFGSEGGVILSGIAFRGFPDTSFYTSRLRGYADTGTPVPEPSSVVLFLLGGVGALAMRNRRKNS